jgi:hypothetical protein
MAKNSRAKIMKPTDMTSVLKEKKKIYTPSK